VRYYLPEYNWSVENYKGGWIILCRQPEDEIATDSLVIKRIEEIGESLKEKFYT